MRHYSDQCFFFSENQAHKAPIWTRTMAQGKERAKSHPRLHTPFSPSEMALEILYLPCQDKHDIMSV